MRGSEPDATLYWVAHLLQAGEDPRFIARRISIPGSEDIGLADSNALQVAHAAHAITERIGMPECRLTPAHSPLYMALAPQSNSATTAIGSATKDVQEGRTLPVPKHLKEAQHPGSNRLGHGQDFQDPHNDPRGYIEQDYLGVDKTYCTPSHHGAEPRLHGNTLRPRTSTPGELSTSYFFD